MADKPVTILLEHRVELGIALQRNMARIPALRFPLRVFPLQEALSSTGWVCASRPVSVVPSSMG